VKRIAVIAVSGAVVGLAACTSSAAPGAAPGDKASSPVVPVSCSRQYNAWSHHQGRGLMAALRAVSSAQTTGSTHVLLAALRKAEPAVTRAARHPIPACADPRGYWAVLLMHVNAAVGSTHSASGVRAAMKDVPQIQHKLAAELKQTARS
jgi:hypothetical protein